MSGHYQHRDRKQAIKAGKMAQGGKKRRAPTCKWGLVKSEELLANKQDRGEKSGDSSTTET